MCGIVGWVDWERDLSQERAVIQRMTDTIRRRGPDDEGVWLAPHAALGHRRLAIIDPANGQQPLVFDEGGRTLSLVYNGELYNFRELRDQLTALGHVFRTRCDTEVVLHAYLEWGAGCLERFDGIFAFGIWDESRQELFLARDRLGVKPLFFALRGRAILFASEIKALLAHPDLHAEVDDEGLAELLVTAPPGFAGTPGRSPLRGIEQLRPAHSLRVRRDGTHDATYWQLESRPHEDDAETTALKVRELLVGAVIRQLVSDVPLACLLSGGVDSSGITSIAQRHLDTGKKLQSWSVDFVDAAKDFKPTFIETGHDAPFAREAAEFIGTEHHPVVLDTAQMVEALLDCMRARDLPVSSQHDTSLLLLFRALKEQATVALSGEAADELFGGYGWFAASGPPRAVFPWFPDAPNPFRVSPEVLAKSNPEAYLQRRFAEAEAEVPLLAGESDSAATFRRFTHMGRTRFLDYLLTRKDRLGMYAGVEGRVPFCDHKLIEYVWNVPLELQRVAGVEKTLLRKALTGYLPDSLLYRKKSVFPFFQNVSYAQAIRARASEIVADPASVATPLFDAAHLGRLCRGEVPDTAMPASTVIFLERFIQMEGWIQEYRISFV